MRNKSILDKPVGGTSADIADAIAKKHTQGTDTSLGTLSTQNPPLDADLFIYRASASAWALVTSTGTQIKAFFKTYFDTVYDALGLASAVQSNLGTHTGLTGTSVHGLGSASTHATTDYDPSGAAAAVTPTTLGLVIGTNVLAQRTFGTAANSATGDFLGIHGTADAVSGLTITAGASISGANTGDNSANTNAGLVHIAGSETITGTKTFNNATYSALFTGGNVGIGTTAPVSRLEVSGSGTTEWIRVGTTASGTGGAFDIYSSGTSGFIAGTVGFNANGVGIPMVFSTAGTEKMRLTFAGNVGIGTTNPGARLHVEAARSDILVKSTTNGNNAATYYNANSANGTLRSGGLYFIPDNTAVNSRFSIAADNSTEQLVVTNGGNVGIGTTGPLSKLSINGGLHVGGDSDAGDNNILADGTITGLSFTGGTPNGGTAAAWKPGVLVTGQIGLVVLSTQYLQVDVGGTLIKLATI